MWGFLSGTLALIAIQTFVQPAAANKIATGSGALTSLLEKLLSANTPGIHKAKQANNPNPGPPPGGVNPAGIPNQVIAQLVQNAMINSYAKQETPAKNLGGG